MKTALLTVHKNRQNVLYSYALCCYSLTLEDKNEHKLVVTLDLLEECQGSFFLERNVVSWNETWFLGISVR